MLVCGDNIKRNCDNKSKTTGNVLVTTENVSKNILHNNHENPTTVSQITESLARK